MPMLAVQSAVQPNDVPTAIVVYLVLQQLGPSVFIALAQTIWLNDLLPRLHTIDPTLSKTEVLDAGATGFKAQVPASEMSGVLEEYVTSLDKVFLMVAIIATVAAVLALFVEWKSIKKGKQNDDKEEKLDE